MIAKELVQAYEATTYTTYNPPLEIRIGKQSVALDRLLQEHKAASWAFITAFNPYSRNLTDSENEQRHKKLKGMLQNFDCYEGEGVGEDPEWKPEKSLLVLGISKEEAAKVGKYFEQNAIVVGSSGCPAELLLL